MFLLMQVFQESCKILASYDLSGRRSQGLPFLSESCKIYIFNDCLARFLQDMFFLEQGNFSQSIIAVLRSSRLTLYASDQAKTLAVPRFVLQLD